MRYLSLLVLLLASVYNVLDCADSAKILAIFPFTGRSQYICAENYLKALAARGHEVTVISGYPQKKPIPNFRDVTIEFEVQWIDDLIINTFTSTESKWEELNWGINYITMPTPKVLGHEEVQKWLKTGVTFDLLIVEVIQQEALYALAHHFKSILIGVSSFGTDMRIDELVGNTSPLSYISSITGQFTDHKNFRERLHNLYVHVLEWIHNRFVIIPMQREFYNKFVPNPSADLMKIRNNFSLLLLNQHFSLSIPRPYVPNAIEVAGFHISHKPDKIPADMEAFINASANGAIYFSLGSNIRSKSLSKEKLDILLKIFATLPYNVLFKFEEPELAGKPENVYISKWYPQADVLAHPGVKLFITHGGLLSIIEAIHHGKPMLGMAIFYDQYLNMARVQTKGFALGVNFWNFTTDQLRTAILEMLNNPTYANRAKDISRLYHDQPMKPLERAIYWTEYVLRHKGAPHMRVAAQEMNFVEYHNLDAIAVLFGGLLWLLIFIIWVNYRILKIILKKLYANKEKEKQI